jgi:hypothetical protein
MRLRAVQAYAPTSILIDDSAHFAPKQHALNPCTRIDAIETPIEPLMIVAGQQAGDGFIQTHRRKHPTQNGRTRRSSRRVRPL